MLRIFVGFAGFYKAFWDKYFGVLVLFSQRNSGVFSVSKFLWFQLLWVKHFEINYQTFCFFIVTNISFKQLVLFDTLQLAAGVRGLFSQGATAVVHGCSTHALGPILGEFTKTTGGVALSVHLVLPWQFWNWVPSRVLPQKRHKVAAFCVWFIEKQQLAGGVVSQPHNGMQHTSLNAE